MKFINDQTARLAYLNEKLGELDEEHSKGDQLKQHQESTLQELNGKLTKLKGMAGQYGIDLDTHEEDSRQLKALLDK